MHYDTTVGCNLEAPLKGGGVQQLDRVQGHCDRVTHCHPGLNLKVANEPPSGQSGPHLGKMFEKWAKLLYKWAKKNCLSRNRGGRFASGTTKSIKSFIYFNKARWYKIIQLTRS